MKVKQGKSLNKNEQRQVVSLLLSVLGEKLFPILGEEENIQKLLENTFCSQNCFLVKEEEKIVGILAFKTSKNSFFSPSAKDFFRVYGFLQGIWKMFGALLLEHSVEENELYIEAIAVDSAFQGRGIGSKLMQSFFAYAQSKSFACTSLEVVDTNPKAKALYEKLGFVEVKQSKLGVLKTFFSFSFQSVFFMKKRLG